MSDVLAYKCPNCGGKLVFDSKAQKMKCESCETEMEMKDFEAYDEALKASACQAEEDLQDYECAYMDDALSAHVCQACGGELVSDDVTMATECPYCGNTAIVTEQAADTLKPDFVIPFKLDKQVAKEALQNFYKGKPLLPKYFKEDNRLNKITGMYVPFWLYDSDTNSIGSYHATKVRTWTSGDTVYTKTSHYLVTRSGKLRFEKIPAGASKKLTEDASLEAIEPYDYASKTGFSMAYLSGYMADKYDLEASAQKPRIKDRIRSSVDNNLRSTIRGYTTLSQKDLRVNMKNSQTHYALFPIWMLNTKWHDETYSFVVNGQTGKLVGDLPIDWKRAFWIGAAIFAICAVLFGLIGVAIQPEYDTMPYIHGIGWGVSLITFISFFFVKKRDKKKDQSGKAGVKK